MKISEAISYVRQLSGNAVDDNTLCRWLSELDGRLMLDFHKGSEWMSYSLPQDADHELLGRAVCTLSGGHDLLLQRGV